MILLVLFCTILVFKILMTLTNARCKSRVCLVGKTALITGGNSGIGLQLVKELASRGCTVIIADKVDASSTVRNLIKETHNSHISYRHVDFTSFKSVRLFAEQLKQDVNKLDILVNNAGMGVSALKMTEDGIQEIMQVNYFSHFLLTHLLLDLLLKSSPSRIIYTSSLAGYHSNLTEKNIISEPQKPYLPRGPYSNSKLAGAIMSKVLAKKLEGTGVTSNTFHPGIVKTPIWNHIHSNRHVLAYFLWAFALIFGKNTDEGVQTVLHLACADEVGKVSGKYFMECRPVLQPSGAYDKKFCSKIWDVSEKLVKLQPNEKVEAIVDKYKSVK